MNRNASEAAASSPAKSCGPLEASAALSEPSSPAKADAAVDEREAVLSAGEEDPSAREKAGQTGSEGAVGTESDDEDGEEESAADDADGENEPSQECTSPGATDFQGGARVLHSVLPGFQSWCLASLSRDGGGQR